MKLTTGLLLSALVTSAACAVTDVKQTEVIKRVCSCMLHHSSRPSHAKPKATAGKPLIGVHRTVVGAAVDQRCPCSLHAKHSHKPSKPKAK